MPRWGTGMVEAPAEAKERAMGSEADRVDDDPTSVWPSGRAMVAPLLDRREPLPLEARRLVLPDSAVAGLAG